MALVFFDGNRWKPVSFHRNDVQTDAYIVCPGPSLSKTLDPTVLHEPGITTIAVNKAYPYVSRPDFWIGSDHPTCFDKNLMWEPFTKVLRSCWRDQRLFGTHLRNCPNTLFVDVDKNAHPLTMFDRMSDNIVMPARALASFELAVHLALWIGSKRIHLIGCDFGGPADYHDGTVLTKFQRNSNRRLYADLVKDLVHFAIEGQLRGCEFISCTPESPINEFLDYVPIAAAAQASKGRVPTGWSPSLDARDAAKCRWKGSVEHEKGVVVGVIEEQAWMLPWWLKNFRKHNPDTPVRFADFGINATDRRWCDENAGAFSVSAPESVAGWFRKPFAILQAPFQKIVWMDLDTEVRGPIAALFDKVDASQIAATPTDVMTTQAYAAARDRGWNLMLPMDGITFCSGLISVHRGNNLIEEWAVSSVPPLEHSYRGDHEIINQVVWRRGSPLVALSASDFSLSRMPADNNATILHYAGQPAKNELKRRVVGNKVVNGPARENHNGTPVMVREELDHLLRAARQRIMSAGDTVTILEIGVARGGTGRKMMEMAVGSGKRFVYVGVDPMEVWTPQYSPAILEHGEIHLVPKVSTDAVESVKLLAPDGFDVVLIDGCHCAECVKFDWENYGPMVKQGGYLFFHDTRKYLPESVTDGSPHVGEVVRPIYMEARASDGWEDKGESGGPNGMGALLRVVSAEVKPETHKVADTVIVGCDRAQQWMLPWWHEHYAKHNDYPIVFADFGLSASARGWCEKHGTVVDVKQEGLTGRWLKPLAMQAGTGAGKNLWLDIDCEVRGSLSPVFDGIEAGKLSMHFDGVATRNHGDGTTVYNTGTVGFVAGECIIRQWHEAICGERGEKTDQEVLVGLKPSVKVMPLGTVHLRTDAGEGDCIVYHWTGAEGHARVKDALNAKAKKPCKGCGGNSSRKKRGR